MTLLSKHSFHTNASLVDHYVQKILPTLLNRESGFFFWFPGSGKSFIVDSIVKDPSKYLSAAYNPQTDCLLYIRCQLSQSKTAAELFQNLGYSNLTSLLSWCSYNFSELNRRLILVVNNIEHLPEPEITNLLMSLGQIRSLNPQCIQVVIHALNKPLIERLITQQPLISSLAQNLITMPIISNGLLGTYISNIAHKYQLELSNEEINRLHTFTGGILSLTYICITKPKLTTLLDLKFRSMWNQLPPLYKTIIQKQILNKTSLNPEEQTAFSDLDDMGILKLSVFSEKSQLADIDPLIIFLKKLTPTEKNIWEYLSSRPLKVVNRDLLSEIIWGEKSEYMHSEWAIDQTISRIRNKLNSSRLGINTIETVRGVGYKFIPPESTLNVK